MKISICIPTYDNNGNNLKLIDRCIKSCLDQDYHNFEIIISDHSKTNNLKDHVDSYNTDKIKYFKNENNIGLPSFNTNNAINLSTGDYIKIMNQDDYFYNETTLSKMVNKSSGNDWVVSSFMHFDNDENVFYNVINPKINDDGIHLLNGVNTIGCPSVGMFPKDNFFDTNVIYMIDCELWYHLFKKYGQPKILNEIGIIIVTGRHNLTSQLINDSGSMILQDKNYCYKKYKI
jgi:glycosyltransferase involved in cell wall biosynthesis